MTNKFIYISIFTLLLVNPTNAQFIDIQITIEPELSASVVSDLYFGQIVSNSGDISIELGSPSMGIFSITGFKNQRVYLDVVSPDALVHQDPLVNASIPLKINLAVNNTGVNDYKSSFPIEEDNALVNLHAYSTTEKSNNNKGVWEVMYIYVYGSLNVGNIPNGRYQGEIYLYVEYD